MYVRHDLLEELQERIDSIVTKYGIRERVPISLETAWGSTRLGPDNIVGFGLGEKIVNGAPQGILCLCGYVVRKAPVEQVEPEYLIDKIVRELSPPLPAALSDVMEVGRPTLLHHQGKTYHRVPAGAAIANDVGGPPGTLGAWLTDSTHTFLLTCWHCACQPPRPNVSRIKQAPGGNDIADLFGAVDPSTCSPGTVTVDAAIAKALRSNNESFLLGIGEVRGTKKVNTTYFPVRKSGAFTHVTDGGVVHLSSGMHLTDPLTGVTRYYDRQLMIQGQPAVGPFAAAGDSGSLVVSSDNHAVGLLVGGGGSIPQVFLATPIDQVLAALRRNTGISNLNFVTY
jgi:hypothetical protein